MEIVSTGSGRNIANRFDTRTRNGGGLTLALDAVFRVDHLDRPFIRFGSSIRWSTRVGSRHACPSDALEAPPASGRANWPSRASPRMVRVNPDEEWIRNDDQVSQLREMGPKPLPSRTQCPGDPRCSALFGVQVLTFPTLTGWAIFLLTGRTNSSHAFALMTSLNPTSRKPRAPSELANRNLECELTRYEEFQSR